MNQDKSDQNHNLISGKDLVKGLSIFGNIFLHNHLLKTFPTFRLIGILGAS